MLDPVHPRRCLSLFLLFALSSLLGASPTAFAATSPDGGSGPTLPGKDSQAWCEARLAEVEQAVRQKQLDSAAGLAKEGLETCGDGHGFAAQLGFLAVARGQHDEAARYFGQELVSARPAHGAFDALLRIHPRLSPERQVEIAALGRSAQAPLVVPHMGYANAWIAQVVCSGKQLDAVRRRWMPRNGLRIYQFECPPGTRLEAIFRFTAKESEEAPGTAQSGRLAVEQVLPQLKGKYGIETVEELREAVTDSGPSTRTTSWILSFLMDWPTQAAINTDMIQRDPNDLEAIVTLVNIQTLMGDLDGAMRTLDAAPLETATLHDVRSWVTRRSALLSNRCKVLYLQKKLPEALAACRKSVEMGSRMNGPLLLARLLFLRGEDAQALEHVRTSIANGSQNPESHFLEGLLLQSLGQTEQARAAWARVPRFGPTASSSLGQRRSRAEWLRVLDTYEREQSAESLALCGHYYLDLQLPDRAEACFSRSKTLSPHYSVAERIGHEAESDPERALKQARAELRKRRHPSLLQALAWAEHQAGRPQEALRWVDEAMRMDPGLRGLWHVLDRICADLGDASCLDTYRARGAADR